jgi:hypothetical protein
MRMRQDSPEAATMDDLLNSPGQAADGSIKTRVQNPLLMQRTVQFKLDPGLERMYVGYGLPDEHRSNWLPQHGRFESTAECSRHRHITAL